MLQHFLSILSGAIFVMAVVAGIGPQSLYLISQGIKRNHYQLTSTICFLADGIIILISCIGLAVSGSKNIFLIVNILGLFFISWFLYNKITNLFKKRQKLNIDNYTLTKPQVVLRGLALTWLNPIVFMDSIVIIGGTATHYAGPSRIDFIIGALLGDFIWVFGISYIAAKFSHKLNRASTWVVLDLSTIIIMGFVWYKTLLFIIYNL